MKLFEEEGVFTLVIVPFSTGSADLKQTSRDGGEKERRDHLMVSAQIDATAVLQRTADNHQTSRQIDLIVEREEIDLRRYDSLHWTTYWCKRSPELSSLDKPFR